MMTILSTKLAKLATAAKKIQISVFSFALVANFALIVMMPWLDMWEIAPGGTAVTGTVNS